MKKESLVFHPITLEDKVWINDKLKHDDYAACEYTFVNNYIWRKAYLVEVGQAYGCGVFKYKNSGFRKYSYPIGNGDKKAVIELLMEQCAAEGIPLCMYPVMEQERLKLLKWFPGKFAVDTDRDHWDYVYTVEKLSYLKGRKLHGKRNHIARFMDDDDWSYEALKVENIDECRRMAGEWIRHREEKWNSEMEMEISVLEEALSKFESLGLVGGVLRKKGEIVAFTVGERLNSDTMVVHFEKAFPDLQGAYPMINQQFVLHEGGPYTYVNREEDTGDLGLRKAKLSYIPDILLKKYTAMESQVVYANELDFEQLHKIWHTCFGDSRDYIENYLQKRFMPENMFVIHEDGKPVAMASFLPMYLAVNGEKRNARYVYAVATLPEYRRRGFATKLIKYAAEKYREPLILLPENESLKAYYSTLGFQEAFLLPYHQKEVTLVSEKDISNEPKEQLGIWQADIPAPELYKQLRDSYFEQEGYVEWDEEAIAYAIRENDVCGGRTLVLSKTVPSGEVERRLLMYRSVKDTGELYIVETTLEKEMLDELMPVLLENTGTDKLIMKQSEGMLLFPQGEKWNCKCGYLNLTLG